MYSDRIMMNTMCRWLCSTRLPDLFTYKLEFRIARGMVKNRLCQGSPVSPSGCRVGWLHRNTPQQLLGDFPQEGHQKNNK